MRTLVKEVVKKYNLFDLKHGGDRVSDDFKNRKQRCVEAAVTLRLSVYDHDGVDREHDNTDASGNTLRSIVESYMQQSQRTESSDRLFLELFKVDRDSIIKREEIAADVKKREIAANVTIQTAKSQVEQTIAEARIQESKDRVILAEIKADRERCTKRPRPVSLAEFARSPYRNATCLSHAVWEARPDGDESIETIFACVLSWCRAKKITFHVRQHADFPTVKLVYINGRLEHTKLACEFWESHGVGMIPSMTQTTPPSDTTTKVEEPTIDVFTTNVHGDTPPENERCPINPAAPMFTDLVEHLISHYVCPELSSEREKRTKLMNLLLSGFVQPLRSGPWRWMFLLPASKGQIMTTLDLINDPVVPRLIRWISGGLGDHPPPSEYPYDDEDTRSTTVTIPSELQTLPSDFDVVPIFERAGLQSFFKIPRYKISYDKYRCNANSVPPIRGPSHPEVIRQMQRVCVHSRFVDFKFLSSILGWTTTIMDATAMKILTHVLLHPRPMSEWYDNTKKSSPCMWRPDVCLWAMRMAAIYMARLHQAECNLDFINNDLRKALPCDMAASFI